MYRIDSFSHNFKKGLILLNNQAARDLVYIKNFEVVPFQ
jgi:hypothetical protein